MTEEPRSTRSQTEMFGTLLASKPKRDFRGAAKLTVGSIVFHAALVASLFWATMSVGREIAGEDEVAIFEIPLQEEPPPPPPPPKLDMDTPPTVEVARGFQTLELPAIIPPTIPSLNYGAIIRPEDYSGVGKEGGRGDGTPGAPTVSELALAPRFMPMTVRPELLNREEVSQALVRDYPPLLRDASIGGTPLLWFLIDENGNVIKTEVKTSSGYQALDEAAARVARIMRFSPAKNRDKNVPVWIEIPIQFRAR